MVITFGITGYYDWEDADKHPGVVITEADVKQLRAKKIDVVGQDKPKWHIRLEKSGHTHFDACITELQICDYLAGRASAGEELNRQQAVMHLLGNAAKHHVARRHVTGSVVAGKEHPPVTVHDDGPVPALMTAALESRGITGMAASEAMDRYMEPSDLLTAIEGQHAPVAVARASMARRNSK